MNKSIFLGLLMFALCISHTSYAQVTERTCEEKIAIAKTYFRFVDDLDVKLNYYRLEAGSSLIL